MRHSIHAVLIYRLTPRRMRRVRLRSPPRRETLLVDVAADRRQRGTVRLKAVGPEIGPEYAPRLLDVVNQPGQRDAQRISIVEAADREVARLPERPVNAARRPRVLAMEVLAQRHGMHDRQDARAAVVVL